MAELAVKKRSRERAVVACDGCGIELTRLVSALRKHNFCSHPCYAKSRVRSEATLRLNAERYSDSWRTVKCAHCGTEFQRQKSKVDGRDHFCDRTCKNLGRRVDQQLNANGYAYVFIGKGEPGASKSGHILEHRKVMQDHLGRPLLDSENVHHKNGIRTDNRIENLELWSRSQPCGQRVDDKVQWAREIIALYGDIYPAKE